MESLNGKGWLVTQMSSAKREISGWDRWKKETIRKEISEGHPKRVTVAEFLRQPSEGFVL